MPRAEITFVQFEAHHVRALELDPAAAMFITEDDARRCAHGYSITCMVGGKPVASAGLMDLWFGVMNAWMLVGPNVPIRAWPEFRRREEEVMCRALAGKVHRIQATVDPTNGQACRWAQWLGFKPEGIQEQYTPDRRDVICVARTRPRDEGAAA